MTPDCPFLSMFFCLCLRASSTFFVCKAPYCVRCLFSCPAMRALLLRLSVDETECVSLSVDMFLLCILDRVFCFCFALWSSFFLREPLSSVICCWFARLAIRLLLRRLSLEQTECASLSVDMLSLVRLLTDIERILSIKSLLVESWLVISSTERRRRSFFLGEPIAVGSLLRRSPTLSGEDAVSYSVVLGGVENTSCSSVAGDSLCLLCDNLWAANFLRLLLL